MPADETADCAHNLETSFHSAEHWAGLFAPDAEVREIAIAEVAREGEKAIPCLAQIVQRPLGYALDCWPEWKAMLPLQAIMARCEFAQRAALKAMSCIGCPAVAELSRLLANADPCLREQAADALRRMDAPEAVDALRHSLEQELAFQKRAHWQGNCRRAAGSVGAAFPVLFLALVCHAPFLVAGGCAVFSGVLAWLLLACADRGAGLRQTAITALGETGDKRHIGILTHCLNDPNCAVRQSVSDALTRLLPKVRIQDKAHISRSERTALLRALDGDNPDLAVAVLGAMQHIGDEQILRQVAFVIDSPVHHAAVREAAHECLPQVKQRVKEAQDAQVLLRCASKQRAGAAHLLRPLHQQTASDHEEQLLKPY